jgi:anti-anti-sigma regulatory factor
MEDYMAASSLLSEVKPEPLAESLTQARKKLDAGEREIVLDFSHVRRIDSSAIQAMVDLADEADVKKVKIILRGVSVDLHKVLKLMRLASRFSSMD